MLNVSESFEIVQKEYGNCEQRSVPDCWISADFQINFVTVIAEMYFNERPYLGFIPGPRE
jgi:hypothetical protein